MEEIDKREAEHVTTMQALENEYEHKLAVEIARYDEVSEAMERQQQDIASEIDKLKVNHIVSYLRKRSNILILILKKQM